ncbi:hypothetical protein PYW08_002500 [Mythimna loreyi]|uniref:Uncharacterized protein n=1 Tax=Mythimna loreyi TaxID=667449 RepID=A0ACC2QJ51_9NEOP|nr:hypothetical protein PYW08_002500 [Mythimna loreyi]
MSATGLEAWTVLFRRHATSLKLMYRRKYYKLQSSFQRRFQPNVLRKEKALESSDEMTISDISNESDSDIDQARAGEIDLHKKKQRSQAKIQSKIPAKTNKKRRIEYKDSSDEMSISNNSDESESEAYKDSECKECFEEYKKTKSTADWIQCVMCKKWLHEDCTMYGDYCNKCVGAELAGERFSVQDSVNGDGWD